MFRTKHFVLIFVLAVVILGVLFIALTFKNTRAAFTFPEAQHALAIESVNEQVHGAMVYRETTREDMRRSIIAQLHNYVPTRSKTETEDPVVAPSASHEESASAMMCEGSARSDSRPWGPVNITRAEGARVISSLEMKEDGTPRETLQLSEMPAVTGNTACLPQNMVGVALDGRLIEAGVPFATNAEGLAGYALDGFGIFNSIENGEVVTSKDLDACHGHVHSIVWNGTPTSMYHYHLTEDAPYSLSCFRSVPALVQ